VIFCFAGRKENMELQLPLIRRILAEHPEAEYHVWNLARNDEDNQYLRTIEAERITVINEFYGDDSWRRFDDVYRHYATPEFADRLFVKVDDDVIFIETGRFSEFIGAVDTNRDAVVSAKVVNNGACTATEPGLWRCFEDLALPLLDVHLSGGYAEMSHYYALDNWSDMIGQPLQLIPTEDWLSINLIGYDWDMGARMASSLGTPTPSSIAGRSFSNDTRLGDEGLVNTMPRLILQGFLACHLYFGPQRQHLTDDLLADFRKRYAVAGQLYLDSA
jgi:hypothetical protein